MRVQQRHGRIIIIVPYTKVSYGSKTAGRGEKKKYEKSTYFERKATQSQRARVPSSSLSCIIIIIIILYCYRSGYFTVRCRMTYERQWRDQVEKSQSVGDNDYTKLLSKNIRLIDVEVAESSLTSRPLLRVQN